MRDDFNQKTKKLLEERAGNRCSKPGCGIRTRGASSDDDGTINVGYGAHITAASPNGPRYEPTLTNEQRKHHSNGIWLCGTDAKLVDSDEEHFTVEELHSWKRAAEQRSFEEVVSSKLNPIVDLLSDDEDVQAVVDLLRGYSQSDLLAFRNMPGYPSYAIELNLKVVDETGKDVFTVSGLASAIETFDEIAVIAPPGTGKTTTLLQLAEAVLGNASCVAVFVPLSEWSTSSDTFFQALLGRKAFRQAEIRQFELLAEHGRLVLILDGWNELDAVSKQRVRYDITSLRRDFPDVRLVVSSRHNDFDIPIDGPVVEVDVLTEEQQLDIAKAQRGSDGESLIDHAWRTPGLRELVAIPLYLTALLKHVSGGALPTTKEEVLQSFVLELERDPDKRATLREELEGCHRSFLEAIAVEATCQQSVALSEAQARAVVNTTQGRLMADLQIAQHLKPMKVIDALVDAHMLVRAGAESVSLSFQHQQFQEWFASFWVEKLMLAAVSGDIDAKKTLREDVLDIPVWEEAILFACDRISRGDQRSIQAVANTILETLGIDPLLSATMTYRSSDEVWELVKDDSMFFVGKWHTEGCVDRAVTFMIDTGRAEFSKYIWPLISNPDMQVHLPVLRSGQRFRPSVLGPNVQERIASLPEELRSHIVAEIASNSGMDGIEFATCLAKNDSSPEVQKSVIEALLFRRAYRFAKEILESSPDEVWSHLARRWSSHEFGDPQVAERMEKEVAGFLDGEADPCQVLNTILSSNVRESGMGLKVHELTEKIDFSGKSQDNASLIHRAHELYPGDVVDALVSQLASGRPVPFRTEELLRASDVVIEEGPLVELVLRNSGEQNGAEVAVSIVGPRIIAQLIDQMFVLLAKIKANDGMRNQALSDEYHRLLGWISNTKLDLFIHAVLERAQTENLDEIALLADLISRHGGSIERGLLEIDSAAHALATTVIQRWAKILLATPEATRAQFAEIAQAVERLGSDALVPVLHELLLEGLARQKRSMEELAGARKNGSHIQNDAHMSWTLQYRRAFAAIGDDQTVQIMKTFLPNPDFGFDAACVLKAVWKGSQIEEAESGNFRSWPDFSVVPEQYIQRQSEAGGETHEFVNDLLTVIDHLIQTDAEPADYRHALKLATVAFSMPYVDKGGVIASLLQLPVPTIDKQHLLTALVLAGETIPSAVVLQGIDELLEEAATKPWMLTEQDGWRLKAWLKLLPFTGMSGSILDVLDRLEDHQLEPWNLRELLSALNYAPSVEAEKVLNELVKKDGRFLSDYAWLAAMTKHNTLAAARILLELIFDASFVGTGRSLGIRDFGIRIAAFMNSHEQFRHEVYERYPIAAESPTKSILEYAIAESPDTDGILLLVRIGAAHDKRFRDTPLYTALRHVLIGQTPIESSGMQQLHSLPAPELRKGLFDMVVNGNVAECRLANESLTVIDEIRDDYGWVASEVRHPDIKSGKPWPLEAMFYDFQHEDNSVPMKRITQNFQLSESASPVDITTHYFDVSVSFPGEVRETVELIVSSLEELIGPNSCFYDNNYKSQLARPSLDELLQDIYRNRSKLIVVFLCEKYQEKEWCGVEFRAIRELIFERENEKVMFIKMDEGAVSGVFKTDGYIDGKAHAPEEIAVFIQERLSLLPPSS